MAMECQGQVASRWQGQSGHCRMISLGIRMSNKPSDSNDKAINKMHTCTAKKLNTCFASDIVALETAESLFSSSRRLLRPTTAVNLETHVFLAMFTPGNSSEHLNWYILLAALT